MFRGYFRQNLTNVISDATKGADDSSSYFYSPVIRLQKSLQMHMKCLQRGCAGYSNYGNNVWLDVEASTSTPVQNCRNRCPLPTEPFSASADVASRGRYSTECESTETSWLLPFASLWKHHLIRIVTNTLKSYPKSPTSILNIKACIRASWILLHVVLIFIVT